jgi:hypothetical protein
MLQGTCRVDDRVNEESIIWHTGLGVVIEVNIEVGMVCTRTSWSLQIGLLRSRIFDKVQGD